MQLRIEITDPQQPLAVMVAREAEVWPELLDTFLAAVVAAKYTLGRTDLYDAAIDKLTEQRDALLVAQE